MMLSLSKMLYLRPGFKVLHAPKKYNQAKEDALVIMKGLLLLGYECEYDNLEESGNLWYDPFEFVNIDQHSLAMLVLTYQTRLELMVAIKEAIKCNE